jgi:hypothetical protein
MSRFCGPDARDPLGGSSQFKYYPYLLSPSQIRKNTLGRGRSPPCAPPPGAPLRGADEKPIRGLCGRRGGGVSEIEASGVAPGLVLVPIDAGSDPLRSPAKPARVPVPKPQCVCVYREASFWGSHAVDQHTQQHSYRRRRTQSHQHWSRRCRSNSEDDRRHDQTGTTQCISGAAVEL